MRDGPSTLAGSTKEEDMDAGEAEVMAGHIAVTAEIENAVEEEALSDGESGISDCHNVAAVNDEEVDKASIHN